MAMLQVHHNGPRSPEHAHQGGSAQTRQKPLKGDMQVITEPKKVIYTPHDCHNRAFIVTFYFSLKGTKPVKNGEILAPGRTEVFTLPCNARACLSIRRRSARITLRIYDVFRRIYNVIRPFAVGLSPSGFYCFYLEKEGGPHLT